jgi:hypothetical protein
MVIVKHDLGQMSLPILCWPQKATKMFDFEAHYTSLTQEMIEILEQENFLKAEEEKIFCTHDCLYRYLKSRKNSVSHAAIALKQTLVWRNTYYPGKITFEEVEKYAVTGKCYINGFDKEGRPLIYMRPTRENYKKDVEGQIRFLVFNMENAIKLMPKSVHQLVILIDFEGFRLSDAPPFKVTNETINLLSAHYPERLKSIFMINAPIIFWTFWKVVSPFIDSGTYAKVQFIHRKNLNELLDHIDSNMLESCLGGQHYYDYHHESYWDLLKKTIS